MLALADKFCSLAHEEFVLCEPVPQETLCSQRAKAKLVLLQIPPPRRLLPDREKRQGLVNACVSLL